MVQLKSIRKPKHQPKNWLRLIEAKLERIFRHSFELGGKQFVTSRSILDEPFIWNFLISSGILIPLGRLHENTFTRDSGLKSDPIRQIGRREIFKAAQLNFYPQSGAKALKEPDPRLYNRSLYMVDKDLLDSLSHWDLWAQNDGAKLVSEMAIIRRVRTKRRLSLRNANCDADHDWDQPG